MLALSNRGYGKVSANIINDLISGNYNDAPQSRPNQESLELFFSRIKDAEGEFRPFPSFGYFATPDLNRVYSDDVPPDSKLFLNYFLNQLNSVIEETRSAEDSVEAFINNCNRYLAGNDESIDEYLVWPDNDDTKRLVFNRRNLEVKVISLITQTEVPLESLSSGEKQMLSLFARLYLYPGKKIVLIDEPELSLSLDWQRQILPDVLRAPSCSQVIAITHSPFIFDNELEDFAGSLRSSVSTQRFTKNLELDLGGDVDGTEIE